MLVFDYIYPIIQGLSTAIVLVRVEMGLAYDADKTIKTSLRFATSEGNKDDTDNKIISS